ncbi:MAG TPA: hypothetical protein VD971_03025 [Phycisphaerales bacterium]|nr:hypothetical protein [Phycisphaerales bacterium]
MALDDFEPLATIGAFAARVAAAAGKSTNMELVRREDRAGGNGPLAADAFAALGASTTFIGCVADDRDPSRVHPVFERFAARCGRVVPLGPPGHTEALEFEDGKVMFNLPGPIQRVGWKDVLAAIEPRELRTTLARADVLMIVNWSIMAGVEEIVMGLTSLMTDAVFYARPCVFVDLSDPAKRTDADVARVLGLLERFSGRIAPVTLGLNLAEAQRLARVLGVNAPREDDLAASVPECAGAIRAAAGLDCVAIHPREGAGGADANGAAWFDGPLTRTPALSTGGGDNFNAGFALSRACGLSLAESLAAATGVSGLYVRNARSPSLAELAAFLADLPGPDAAESGHRVTR